MSFLTQKMVPLMALLMVLGLNSQSTSAADFCTEPLKVVCEETITIRSDRDKLINQIKQEIKLEAEKNAKARLEALGSQGGGLLSGLRRWIRESKIYNQEIIRAAQSRLSSFEQNIVSPGMIATIKNYLKEAVDLSPSSEEQKKDLKKKIDQVVVGNFSDYMERAGVENSFLGQYFRAHCGLDGLVDNAFATRLDNKDYVLICPGWLITLNQEKDAKAVFENVFQVLAHEISHHMDYSEMPKVYENYKQCLKQVYGNILNTSEGDSKACLADSTSCDVIKTEIETQIVKTCSEKKSTCKLGFLCNVQEKLCLKTQRLFKMGPYKSCMREVGDRCLERRVVSHLGEISADFWGAEVLALYINKENLSTQDGQDFIKTNMMNLCGSQDEGIHPSGNFRIERLIRHNAKISNHFGCQDDSITACDLGGKIAL